jgi:Phage integrase, N-terminal SAM-like domain
MFSLPGSSRRDRRRVSKSGFATKREAENAEARRRIEELQKLELAKAGAAGIAAKPPTTLTQLLNEFFAQHVEDNLAPKTAERYHEQAAYIDPGLLAMPLADITPLHLNREWKRLRGRELRRCQLSVYWVLQFPGVQLSRVRESQ